MQSSLISALPQSPPNANGLAHRRNPVHPLGGPPKGRDIVQLGATPLNQEQSMRVILENAYLKIQGVVDDAKAELGIEPGAAFDTSPEATANRILDFALNFYEQYKENNSELSGSDARKQFAELIGGAILQGIQEARDILSALSAINDETENGIATIENIILEGLDAFLAAGESDEESLLG